MCPVHIHAAAEMAQLGGEKGGGKGGGSERDREGELVLLCGGEIKKRGGGGGEGARLCGFCMVFV